MNADERALVVSLLTKATNAAHAHEAMTFAQAALNAAHALSVLIHAEISDSKPKD